MSGPAPDTAQPPRAPVMAASVLLATALAYAAVGAAALLLAGAPGYASPLFPPAGIALAALLVHGRAALPGIWLGSFALNVGLGALRGQQPSMEALWLPAFIGLGAMLQAAAAAALVRRFVSQPLVLDAPRDIVLFGLLGGLLPCTVSASFATLGLVGAGTLRTDAALANWLTWWSGDTLGVLVAAPFVLTLIGRPRADWRRRRLTLGAPLLLALALLTAGMVEFNRVDRERLKINFERDADRLAAEAQVRLAAPVHALQSLHAAALAQERVNEQTLAYAARWWTAQPIPLLALGYGERVPVAEIPAFESRAQAAGLAGYRVFDRDGGRAREADGEVVAVRAILPREVNRGALGVNSMSVPAAREAILASRDTALPMATGGFRLSQLPEGELGIVVYQALYRDGGAAPPATLEERRRSLRGVVFVTLRPTATLEALAHPNQRYVHWCLLDTSEPTRAQHLAGARDCQLHDHPNRDEAFVTERQLSLAGRTLTMHLHADAGAVPGGRQQASWMLSLAGLAAAAMLGALLLTITGQSRRTELAVQEGTADLRREMADRAAAELAQRESEARLRTILDNVPLGVVFLDPQGHILESNRRMAEMLCTAPESLRGRSILDFIDETGWASMREQRERLMAGEVSARVDALRLHTEAGTEATVRVIASALRDGNGRVLRMVGVTEDMSDQLRLAASEQALARAEAASRAKSEFVSRMSHELRTPLNAMIGFAQLLGLDREPPLGPRQLEWAQQIQRAGWHLLELINETLDLARIESGAVQLKLEPVLLAPLVAASRSMVSAAAASRALHVGEDLAPEAPAVAADTTRVKQVLTNLLSNAVKYNREGGSVMVSSRRVAEGGQVWVEIAVADTGLGMSAEQMAGLFQPYNRLGREGSGIEGTGIGLAISRRLAELMGGSLAADSAEGRGSTFTLRLPAAEDAAVPLPVYSDSRPAPYQQRRVHYVEDNPTNIEVMRGILAQRPQIQLETSMLGLDGASAIRATTPDLVLLDMQLPDISGLELLRHLKQDDAIAAIPVVVVSADATPENMQRALTLGAAHYVTKPLDVARFLSIVDGILEAADTRWG